MTAEQIQTIYDQLYPYSQVDAATKEKHIADIEQTVHPEAPKPVEPAAPVPEEQVPIAISEPAETPLRCPRCGGELLLRTAKKGNNAGNQFYGCSNFPKCRYIQTP